MKKKSPNSTIICSSYGIGIIESKHGLKTRFKNSHHPTPTLIILDGQKKKHGCSHNQMSKKTCQAITKTL
jgi:hypothetical protein